MLLVERWLILGLGLYGVFVMYRSGRSEATVFLVFFPGGLVTTLVVYVNGRIFLPAAIALVVPAACGLEDLLNRLGFPLAKR